MPQAIPCDIRTLWPRFLSASPWDHKLPTDKDHRVVAVVFLVAIAELGRGWVDTDGPCWPGKQSPWLC